MVIDASACRSLTLDDGVAPRRFDDELMTDDQGPDRCDQRSGPWPATSQS